MADLIHFNGLNGATGEPLVPPVKMAELAGFVAQELQGAPKEKQNWLNSLYEKWFAKVLGVREDFREQIEDPHAVGWGVIYAPGTPPEVKQALAPLVAHRKGKEFTYDGKPAVEFRKKYGQMPGPVDPNKIPYYLLIVGSPQDVAYDFQFDLDVEHAVGRLYFPGTAEYGGYVEKLLGYETNSLAARTRRVAFFSPDRDSVTKQNADLLTEPLGDVFAEKAIPLPGGGTGVYQVEMKSREAAKKAALLDLLARETDRPALVFTASHGVGFPRGHARQRQEQGALICQEWPGGGQGELPASMLVSGHDISPEMDLTGLVVYAFACFSAGTPKLDFFAPYYKRLPRQLANEPFVGYLPQRLLAQGALAFIGHVDLAWNYAFGWPSIGPVLDVFEDSLTALLRGAPVGNAMEYFSHRYLDLNHELTKNLLAKYVENKPVDAEMIDYWTARNDARAYVVFGDPAARVRAQN